MLPIVILAGGLATRLRPITKTIPKSMILVNEKPFIFHQLNLFKKRKIKHIHFCLGYLGYEVEKYVRHEFKDFFDLTFSYDGSSLLGTGGAILNAFEFLPETFFVTYGDSYLEIDYTKVEKIFFSNVNHDNALMAVLNNKGKWDTSNVVYNEGCIKYYSKKNKLSEMQHIDYGLGILNKSNFENRVKGDNFDLSEIYEKLSIEGKLIGYEVAQRFFEVGSFSGIEDLSNHLTIINKSMYSKKYLEEVIKITEQLDVMVIEKMVQILSEVRKSRGRLFFLGIGGSAANCSHAVNDFRKIVGIETYAPTDNVSELTARTNDEGWDTIFSEWLKISNLTSADVVFVFSVGGGNIEKNISPNLVKALQLAKKIGSKILGIVGRDGGYTATVADAVVIIPTVNLSNITPHSEAFQAVIWHLLVSHPILKNNETKWESVLQ